MMNATILYPADGVQVAWREQPFTGECITTLRPIGYSIGELVKSVHPNPDRFFKNGVVCINGDEVPRELWDRVRPKKPVVVTFHQPLRGGGGGGGRGGGGGKSVIALVASIALVATGLWIGAGAGGLLTGSILGISTAKLAAASFTIVGALLIGALTPPPSTQSNAADDTTSKEAASLDGNIIGRGQGLPRVVGTHRIMPPLITEPLVEPIDDDEYVEAIYGLAGPHLIEDIRIGEASIADEEDISFEVREGWPTDSPSELVARHSHTDNVQLTLSSHKFAQDSGVNIFDQSSPSNSVPKNHTIVSRESPDQIWLTLLWPEGLLSETVPSDKLSVPFRIRIRKRGDSAWNNLPEVHFTSRQGGSIRKAIKIIWGTAPSTTPTPGTDKCANLAFKVAPGQTVDIPTSGWTAHSHFSAGAGNDVISSTTVATTNVRNVALYSDRAEFYLSEATFPKGIYEVNIIRGHSYYNVWLTESSYLLLGVVRDFFFHKGTAGSFSIAVDHLSLKYKVQIPNITTVWYEPAFKGTGVATIAVRAKNRRVDQLSTLASGYVRDWDGNGWNTWTTTSNPAPHLRDVFAGDLNSDPLPEDMIDNDSLLEFRDHCTNEGFEVNAVIEGMAADEAARIIASSGYGRVRRSELYGVFIDKDRSDESPVQHFNPRNLESFRWEKAFSKLPDGFRVSYRNADNDYKAEEIVVNDEDVTSAQRLDQVSYVGLTTEAEVIARAEFDLAQARVRMTFYYGECDEQSLVATRGSLVAVQHDTIDQDAGYARIKSVIRDPDNENFVIGLTLDSKILVRNGVGLFATPALFSSSGVFGIGARTGIAIRCTDGSHLVEEIIASGVGSPSSSDEETAEVDFIDPVPDPVPFEDTDPDPLIGSDCLASSGRLGSEVKRMIVFDAKPKKGNKVSLTFVDEAPELFA